MEPFNASGESPESIPPRGFLEFDKPQLDPVRREYMERLRFDMLDFNEEYLAKHPQVEAVLRLILMEVICHKPFNVRQFIKQLLMSDNLETRVAKIILSKRINLDQSHTREYFSHVADWESKSGVREEAAMESWIWPEPRPRRPTTSKDRPGYSHLHYYKEPFWLYPKEFFTVAERNENAVPPIKKLPAWVSGFLQAEFFQKWGPAYRRATQTKPGGKAKRHRRCTDKLIKALIKNKKRCKKTELKKNQDEEEYKIFGNDVSQINKNRMYNCSTCRQAVRGSRLTEGRCSTCCTPERRTQTTHKSSTSRHKSSFETVVELLERDWRAGEKMQVLRSGGRLQNERGEPLREVAATVVDDQSRPSIQCRESSALATTKWSVKTAGDEISFVLPEKRLQEVDTKNERKEILHIKDPEVPEMYKTPLYQIVMPKRKSNSFLSEDQPSSSESGTTIKY